MRKITCGPPTRPRAASSRRFISPARMATRPVSDCVFCGIASRAIPGHIVYEDRDFVAFLDLYPWTRGHLLVIPRGHYDRLRDLPAALHGPFLSVVAELCRRVERLTPDYNVAINQGPRAGQIVFHLHAHIIPRYDGENPFAVPHRQKLDDGDARRVVEVLAPERP